MTDAHAVRAALAGDPHRPQYHFLPPANWMNDPNGLIHWDGQYHLFYQHNPFAPFWATMHWGHAASPDLVHWTDLPIALSPTPGGPDKDGCYSGCAVDNHGVPTILYTGVQPQVQCLAWSDDGLITWKKYPRNPVLASPPPGLDLTGSPPDLRDPWVWHEGDVWTMLVGSGIRGVGGVVLVYQSPDLLRWQYAGPLLVGDKAELGETWECPALIPVGDRHVLLLSVHPEFRHTYYLVGTYSEHKFEPEIVGKTDEGPYIYAAQAMVDRDGQRLMWGWIKEGRAAEACIASGWAGVMSLPRVLGLRPGGKLAMQPAAELQMLRGEHYHRDDLLLPPGGECPLDGFRGDCAEIVAEFETAGAGRFGLWTHRSPDREERTLIGCDMRTSSLVIDRGQSSTSPAVDREMNTARLSLAADQPLRLHIFLDRSVIEIFAGDEVCLTSRVYPSRTDSTGIVPVAFDSPVRLKSLDIWRMRSIW